MRISDWSSDVCSSDLAQEDEAGCDEVGKGHAQHHMATPAESHGKDDEEQQCRDRGGPTGLQLHLEEAPDLLHIKSTHPRPVHIADHRTARFGATCRYGDVNFMLFVHDENAYRVATEHE